jgi:AraC-like DNA-binding protein
VDATYSESLPDPRLAPYVECLWVFRAGSGDPPTVHVVPPDGAVSLVCNVRTAALRLAGPHVTPQRPPVRAGDMYRGARLWPGAAPALLHVDPAALRDRSVPTGDLLDEAWAAPLAERLAKCRDEDAARRHLEKALLALVSRARPFDLAVMDAVHALAVSDGRLAVGELARRAGLSERQLRRRVHAAVGLSPKELARVRRVRTAAVLAVAPDAEGWAAIAARQGYSATNPTSFTSSPGSWASRRGASVRTRRRSRIAGPAARSDRIFQDMRPRLIYRQGAERPRNHGARPRGGSTMRARLAGMIATLACTAAVAAAEPRRGPVRSSRP